MEKVNVGIVGTGKVADLHAKALAESGIAEFTAVASRTAEKAHAFAELHASGRESAAGKTAGFDSVSRMVEEAQLDTVIVCTPHPFHLQPALDALSAGAHVLVEKPLAISISDCDRMIETADRSGRTLGVVSQRRFYEPVQRMKQAIDEGKIGKPLLGTVVILGWRDKAYYESDPWRGRWDTEGGGVLVNQAPHQLDLLQWFMGPIEEVFGYQKNLNHPYIEVEDTAVAVIRFKNGGLGSIVVSNSQKPGVYGKVHVHGENGASVGVQTDGGAMFVAGMSGIAEPPVNDLWTVPGEEALLQQWKQEDSEHFLSIDPTVHYLRLQQEDFLSAAREGRAPLVTAGEGKVTVEIFNAIYNSGEIGKPVSFQ